MAAARPIEGTEIREPPDGARMRSGEPGDRGRDQRVVNRSSPGLLTPVSAYASKDEAAISVSVEGGSPEKNTAEPGGVGSGASDRGAGAERDQKPSYVKVDAGEDDLSQRRKQATPLTAQAKFLKETQDSFKMYHKYPSESFMIYPPDGSMGDAAMDGAENDDDDSTRRPIFVWRPELAYPEAFEGGRPPCPRCKTSTHVTSKGWMQHGSRRGILREGSCDLTCYWYSCKKCREDNKGKLKGARVPEAFKGWDSGVLEQLPLHVQAMFPFVLRTRSALHVDVATSAMDVQADEFCVVEPLTLIEESAAVKSSGIAEAIESLELAGSAAPNTPIPLPKPPSGNRDNRFANTEGWAVSTVVSGASTTGGPCNGNGVQDIISPPWTPTDPVGNSGLDRFTSGLRAGIKNGVGPGMTESMLGSTMGTIVNSGTVAADPAYGAAGAVSTTHGRTPRRKRTSGINRQLGMGSRAGNAGPGGGGVGAGRRRGGPGNGKGGLSKKTLNIVTNLRSHTAPVRSQQELEEMEEEKRLAEEERRFKENLRQKGDDFDHTIRILLLGDSGVGKTSLMLRFSEDKFAPTMISTAGVDFKVQTLDIHGKRVRCQIWDTAGQEKFHVITRAYYRGAHGIALAYDLTDEDSFKNVNYWMANIQTHADAAQRIQKMILGNKVDIEERAISTKDGQAVAKEFGVRFFEVSAKNGHGVSDAFYTLAVDIVQSLEAAQRRGSDDRRASRIFGSARLRSLTSRRPTFGLPRTGISVGKVGVVIGSGSGGGLTKKTGSESAQEGKSSEEGVESLGGSVGDRYSTERCKVS